MARSTLYAETPNLIGDEAYLVNNQDVRGVGPPYAIPGTFREASLPADPNILTGTVTTISLAAIPSPIIV